VITGSERLRGLGRFDRDTVTMADDLQPRGVLVDDFRQRMYIDGPLAAAAAHDQPALCLVGRRRTTGGVHPRGPADGGRRLEDWRLVAGVDADMESDLLRRLNAEFGVADEEPGARCRAGCCDKLPPFQFRIPTTHSF